MHPVLRVLLGILVLIGGFYALYASVTFIWMMIKLHPVIKNGGYTTTYVLQSGGMLLGGLALSCYFFYRAYKLLKPPKKEKPIEFLGEDL